jgi:hypothetical protein
VNQGSIAYIYQTDGSINGKIILPDSSNQIPFTIDNKGLIAYPSIDTINNSNNIIDAINNNSIIIADPGFGVPGPGNCLYCV